MKNEEDIKDEEDKEDDKGATPETYYQLPVLPEHPLDPRR